MNPANNILRFRTVASMLSKAVLASTSAYERCSRRASISASRGIGGALSGEFVEACHSQAYSGSTSRTRRVVSRSPRLSATAPSTVSAHPGDHKFPVPLEAHPGPLKTPRYLETEFSVCADRCCCCSHINSHNRVRGHRTGSSHSGAEEYPREKHKPRVVHAYITADAIHASTRNI